MVSIVQPNSRIWWRVICRSENEVS